MDEMYGFHSTTSDYADKALMSPENLLMMQTDYYNNNNSSTLIPITPMFGSDQQLSSEAASFTYNSIHHHDEDGSSSIIKAKISSHPYYPKLLQAFIDCQKVGAPPEIVTILEEIKQQNEFRKTNATSICIGADPELDEFMETYCDILVKYKSDLSKPFDEATTFLNKIELQLSNLRTDDGAVLSSDEEEFSCGEVEGQDASSQDIELKDRLLRKFGSHLSTLKLEFSKKKKKGKLPKEARQMLLAWWNDHYRWPYPTEADKNSLAESTGLDPKQINNWFINQRKRHWKPSENMQLAVMDNLSSHFFSSDD